MWLERVCRRAFEGTNVTKLVVPADRRGAYGVGTSATNRDGVLMSPIKVIVNGTLLTLTHM